MAGHEFRSHAVASDRAAVIQPTRYAFRSFDRQWIIPDNRLINRANPTLWKIYSAKQIFVTAPEDRSITIGPAITISALIPDLHHYHGRGGRVYPLWSDAKASQPNICAEALATLGEAYGASVAPEDVVAYIAAVMAHPAFTKRFAPDLVRPGLRVPLTADTALFAEAVALGREVVWLYCYGERFVDAAAGRPKGPPRLPKASAPRIPSDGAIPPAPEPLPARMDYDAAKRRLIVGKGYIENVTPAMRAYEISGKNVLDQWFGYRRLDSKPIIGDRRPPSPLEKIQPEGWLAEYTEDLLNLLNVLGRLIALEARQADLLTRICDGALIEREPVDGENDLDHSAAH
ncbi:MAG TPA: type ISP restriction/modification enzyme [Methylocystis sp.]|nr:type ISP restriction/modification enzyme [Methylocystis sp.]